MVTVSGQVSDSDGQLVAGARVRITPGTVETISNGQGLYAIEVPVLDDETPIVIAVSHDDFLTVTVAVVLLKTNPTASFDVELTARDEDPPLEALHISQHSPPGAWTSFPTTDFIVDIGNQGSSTISNLVISDTLDAEFAHAIVLENITINDALFPSAVVTISPDGRAFESIWELSNRPRIRFEPSPWKFRPRKPTACSAIGRLPPEIPMPDRSRTSRSTASLRHKDWSRQFGGS